jgi:ABC-type branched-subunit amino acid transport system substrate-binding protein
VARPALVLLAAALLAGCAGEDEPERELQPGTHIRIGVVGPERLVAEGARVEANRLNNAGGIGGAAIVDLERGSVRELVDRGVRLLVLPCRRELVEEARRVAAGRALAVAPCDDGRLEPLPEHVFSVGLSPEAQARALADRVDGEAAVLPAQTRRGRRVAALLGLSGEGATRISPDAPEHAQAPPEAPDGTLFATFGFPQPGSRTDEFYERFRAVFGRRPESIVAALASDALTVLAVAIESAASSDPRLVEAELLDGLDARGVLGDVELPGDSAHAEVDATILRLRDGRLRVDP